MFTLLHSTVFNAENWNLKKSPNYLHERWKQPSLESRNRFFFSTKTVWGFPSFSIDNLSLSLSLHNHHKCHINTHEAIAGTLINIFSSSLFSSNPLHLTTADIKSSKISIIIQRIFGWAMLKKCFNLILKNIFLIWVWLSNRWKEFFDMDWNEIERGRSLLRIILKILHFFMKPKIGKSFSWFFEIQILKSVKFWIKNQKSLKRLRKS